jgi:hypothetical protein
MYRGRHVMITNGGGGDGPPRVRRCWISAAALRITVRLAPRASPFGRADFPKVIATGAVFTPGTTSLPEFIRRTTR